MNMRFNCEALGVELTVCQTNTPNCGRYAIGAFFTGYLAAIHPANRLSTLIVRALAAGGDGGTILS